MLEQLDGKTIVLGVIALDSDEVESAETVAARIERALPYTRDLVAAPDCGMKYLSREAAVRQAAVARRGCEDGQRMSRTCAQMIVHELLDRDEPGYRARRLETEAEMQRLINSGRAMDVAGELITLPVIVHVVYRTDAENVSDAQVASQIDVLNRDFRAANEDIASVPAPWKSLVGDAKIEFALSEDTRTETDAESFGPDDTVKSPRPGAGSRDRLAERVVLHARAAGCSATRSSRAARRRDRRGRHPQHGVRDHRHRPRSPSTSGAPPSTRSATGSACATSGATGTTAPATTSSPTRHAPARPTPASRSARTSRATTAPTGTCS